MDPIDPRPEPRFGTGRRPVPSVVADKRATTLPMLITALAAIFIIGLTVYGMTNSGSEVAEKPAAVSAPARGTASAPPAETTGQAPAPEQAPTAPQRPSGEDTSTSK